MTVKSSVSLTDRQAAFARSLVDEGRYPSISAVVQQGLDLLRQKTESEEEGTAALRTILRERAEGAIVSSGEMQLRVSRMLERKRREHGLDD